MFKCQRWLALLRCLTSQLLLALFLFRRDQKI
uniref:Uncharacterized protein n=1 Tax=Anguilla anguilla TaxID=7936 RepID=A0A0E9S474_ANGAN